MDMQTREPRHENRTGEHAFIVGRQPFQMYQRFVRSKWAGNSPPDDRTLTQEWREIQHHALGTDEREAGIAEDPDLLPLPDEMIAIAQDARHQEAIEQSIGMLTSQWWLVEIDRAIVFQPWVDLDFTRELESVLPRPLSFEDHIRVASGTFNTNPKVTVSQQSEDRYMCLSPSTDLRFLGTSLLAPSAVQVRSPRGIATHVIAVFLGSSTNCLSALHINRRLILVNGTHRAYTLRCMGFTHVACLVTHIMNDDEKAQMVPQIIRQNEARYLTAPRPPLFKDYFDPALRRIVPTIPTQTLLKLRLKQTREIVPAG